MQEEDKLESGFVFIHELPEEEKEKLTENQYCSECKAVFMDHDGNRYPALRPTGVCHVCNCCGASQGCS